MAASGDASIGVRVHPLVVMSIADQFTRTAVQSTGAPPKVVGALFGVQEGRTVHISDTFEIGFTSEQKLDLEHFEEDLKLYREAFPQREVLGWYTTGASPQLPLDAELHSQMSKYNERPLLVILDTSLPDDAKDLSLLVFEEEILPKGGTTFARVPFRVYADEAERIAADTCAKVAASIADGPAINSQLAALRQAVNILHERVSVIRRFLGDVAEGKIQAQPSLLRSVKELCHRLPVMDSESFRRDYNSEYNDALLVAYLATLTQGTEVARDVVEHFNTLQGESESARAGPSENRFGMGGLGRFRAGFAGDASGSAD